MSDCLASLPLFSSPFSPIPIIPSSYNPSTYSNSPHPLKFHSLYIPTMGCASSREVSYPCPRPRLTTYPVPHIRPARQNYHTTTHWYGRSAQEDGCIPCRSQSSYRQKQRPDEKRAQLQREDLEQEGLERERRRRRYEEVEKRKRGFRRQYDERLREKRRPKVSQEEMGGWM